MPRLSRPQTETRRVITDLAARGLAPEALGARLLSALQGAVPFDDGRLFAIDPGTLLVNRVLAATHSDGWARREWFREVYLAAEPLVYLELPALMRAGLHAVAFHDRQETCWGYPRELLDQIEPRDHFRLFHELRSPVGGTLHACFSHAGRWVAALQIYRRDAARPFRPGEVTFVRALAPMIGDALHAAFARECAANHLSTPVPEATGILVLDADLSIRLSTPAAETWCTLVRDAERHGHSPLPGAVWSALAGLRAAEGSRLASTVIAPSPAGRVRVEASRAGPDGAVAVVLSSERPPAPPELPLDWPLTDQQRRIATLLARGLSNRRIGSALEMSENTVEWHLRNAYEALGVRSRTQLLARFFDETFLPNLAVAPDSVGSATDERVTAEQTG
jgi:DNA-binding CsgD family transcriptional regulator